VASTFDRNGQVTLVFGANAGTSARKNFASIVNKTGQGGRFMIKGTGLDEAKGTFARFGVGGLG
jgi:hypothetical protein